MVYNAMKLFMEVNPQLFDDCSHDYAEQQNQAEEKKKARQAKWDRLAELAKARSNGKVPGPAASLAPPAQSDGVSKSTTPAGHDDSDPMHQDSQRRLEALRLQDDASARSGGDRRDRQPAVC